MIAVLFPVAAVLLAILAVLLVYAWYKLVYYLSLALIPELPGVFHYVSDFAGWVTGKALGAWDAAYSKMLDWADVALEPLVTVMGAVVAGSEALWNAVLDVEIGTATVIRHIVTQTLPGMVHESVIEAEQVILPAVEQAAHQATTDAINWAQAEANTVWGNTVNLVNGEIGQLQTVIGGIEASISGIPGAIDNAERAAEGFASGAIDQLQGWTQGAIEALRGELLGGIGATAGELHGFEGEARDTFDRLTGRTDILENATTVVIPAAIAVVATELDDWLKHCGKPLCDNLGPLANMIPVLSDLFSLGLFMAWMTYCIRDPEDAARDTVTVAGPIADSVGSAVQAVV